MKLLQVNAVVNYGSTGRIAENIGKIALEKGWESHIAFGRKTGKSASQLIRVENKSGNYLHVVKTRLTDLHGLGSTRNTRKFIKKIERIKPNIVHLHNIHGYYINYEVLFEYLTSKNTPVIWTLHDCWTFTGHCAHFEYANCFKWQIECHDCPELRQYPASYLIDGSKRNFNLKKKLFPKIEKLHLVPVSQWLSNHLDGSFFKDTPKSIIHNGIDLSSFKRIQEYQDLEIKYNLEDKFVLLGVASVWNGRKGLKDLIQISGHLKEDEKMVIIGLNETQLKSLPKSIIGLQRTDSVQELIKFYSRANVFLNPTYEDNFPTTNLESMACGTPVVTYNTGGSPESITNKTGKIIPKNDFLSMLEAARSFKTTKRGSLSLDCINHVKENYEMRNQFLKYFDLYESVL